MAKPNATDDELRNALHTACADFVYELPNGIDTQLSEHGGGLSEGLAITHREAVAEICNKLTLNE